MRIVLPAFTVDIALAPLIHIDGKHSWIDQSSSELLGRVRRGNGLIEALRQIAPNARWNVAHVRRIDICEQHQMPIEHLPVRLSKVQQAIPFESRGRGSEQVRSVSA